MLLILRVFNLIITYFYFFRESFIAELIISFVPYIIAFCLLAIILGIYLIIHQIRNKIKHKGLIISLTVIAIILTIGIGTFYSLEYFGFYNQPDESIRLANPKGIKVFYANIYYKNTDYKSIQEKIEQEDPDIVILVEFSDEHEKEMKDFFKTKYPYMNRNSWSITLAGDVVFSKIPLKNITETHIVERGARNYSYMKILCDNCGSGIDLYVVHTAAPASLSNFYMRNSQLEKFKFDFIDHQDKTSPTVVIGDFNVSPRSYYYKLLTKDRNLINALSLQSPNYTRSLFKQKIFCSHIDQIFVSQNIKISEINIEDLPGSDHRSSTFFFGI